jgi:hypothetical protein
MKGKVFTAQEMQSILTGNKTMFREVIKPYPILSEDKSYWEFEGVRWAGENSSYAKKFGDNARPDISNKCPYQVGQKLKLFNAELLIKEIKVERLGETKPEEKFEANPWVWVISFEVVK